jgi:beta-lactamase class A
MRFRDRDIISFVILLSVGILVLVWQFHIATGNSCFKYVNPTVACDTSSTSVVQSHPLQNIVVEKIQDLISNKQADHISAYYLSLSDKDNDWFSINNGRLYYPASYSKLPIIMWFYSQSETDPSIMNREVKFIGGAAAAHPYFDYGGITPGNSYSVPELLQSMMVNSDNNATLALSQIMGDEQLTRTLLDLGLQTPMGSSTSFRIDAKTAASFMRMLYDSSYLTPKDSEEVLDLLTQTKFDKGLQAGVPAEIKVSHKFGEWSYDNEKQLHDCGIVYMPNHPYVLCVLTDGSNFDNLANVISQISHTVYSNIKQ